MADVSAVFGTLLAMSIALPGLLLTWRLLLPKVVERAEQRLARTAWTCFFVGGIGLALVSVPIIIFFNLPGGFQAVGFAAIFFLMTIASLGAAGLAAIMGRRLQFLGLNASGAGATVRGAVALELAAVFPLIGWFIFMPLTFIVVFGAALFALVGWMPRSTGPVMTPRGQEQRPVSA